MTIPLLGGHIRRRATDTLARTSGQAREFSDSKVGQQQVGTSWLLWSVANKKVGGFDILVNDLVVVGMLQCAGSLTNHMGNLLGREEFRLIAVAQPVGERAFPAIGHHQVDDGQVPQGLLPIVIQWQDVWVIEFGNGPGFALKKAGGFLVGLLMRIRADFGPYHLDSHLLLNAGIFGQVDLAHAPATQQAHNAIAANLLSFQ